MHRQWSRFKPLALSP
ncbi:hypothetical protein F383_19643 [Gossypium arboreum]|uniref:Uncharacterized protein n=1 Tax=Gossypium arboreum TaxID=29729 RepID=A0A0B0NII0_GOSAR|nr:hypothetical protein F383_19643 [Gossypium arboreum]